MQMLMDFGWDGDLIDEEWLVIDVVVGVKINWKIDFFGGIQWVVIKYGCLLFGNVKVCVVVWMFLDLVLLYCELFYINWCDFVVDYLIYEDCKFYCLLMFYVLIQKQDFLCDYLIILILGCLVEYEGGGDEIWLNLWFVELQQDMFVEVNLCDVNNIGICDGVQVWVEGLEGGKVKVMVMVIEWVGEGVVFMLFYFGGYYQGED